MLLTTGPETEPSQSGEAEHPTTQGRKMIMPGATVRGPITPVAYDVGEAATALRLSRSALYELIRSGQLRSVKSGRRRLVPVSALSDYLDSLDGAA